MVKSPQAECHKELLHGVTSFKLNRSGDRGGACRSFHHHRMVVFARHGDVLQQQDERNHNKRNCRSGICRAFLLISRASVPHSRSLPKFVWVGMEALIRALTICWASSLTFLSAALNASIAASCFSARKPLNTSSSLTMVSAIHRA